MNSKSKSPNLGSWGVENEVRKATRAMLARREIQAQLDIVVPRGIVESVGLGEMWDREVRKAQQEALDHPAQ